MNKFIIDKDNENVRIDKFLATHTSFSRNYLSNLIEEEKILLNGNKSKASYKLKENDEITILDIENKPLEIKNEDIPLDIVYEDDDILIINKPQGMVVHPSFGHYEHTLVNAILHHAKDSLSGINGVNRPGIVHRIDKDTSGLICVAKNDHAHLLLAAQLKDHTMARTYIALVRGVIKENNGEINLPIGRDKNNRQKMAVTRTNSKEAITYFKVLKRFKEHTLLECNLKTGRTHQIRVHLSYIGYPIEGDPLYGNKKYDKLSKNGQLLVATKLRLIHPTSKEELEFKIDLPDYFQKILDELE